MVEVDDSQRLFRDAGDAWWTGRAFRSLRAVKAFQLERLQRFLDHDLSDLDIVDVGCGGGLLSLPLDGLGARVLGVDVEPSCVEAATRAAEARQARCRFVVGDARSLPLDDRSADLVLLSDVIEHFEDQATAIAEAARVLRPHGHLFVNTICRGTWARFWAITVAEGLGFVPRGTHDARLFVAPDGLEVMARAAGLRQVRLEGETPRLLASIVRGSIQLRASTSTGVAYGALFRKDAA